jgi:AmmeMemoRadiSam system protein B
VAGRFYPAERRQLEASVDRFLGEARGARLDVAPKALIAPHAGYVYSGPIAGSAYAQLAGLAIERVVLVGPAHFVPLRGLAVSGAEAFTTPLGEVPIDDAARSRILRLPQVRLLDAAHAEEHSLEVQLPFLQRVLGPFSLVPLVAGEATDAEVAEVLEELWGGDETLIVISSDLSHYYDYDTARQLDAATTRAIESLEPQGLGPDSACGRVPVRGLLLAARAHRLRARTLDLRSSGDTAGPRDEVVGYGAYAFA